MHIYSFVPLTPVTPIAEGGKQPASDKIGTPVPFANLLEDAVQSLKETQAQSDKAGYDLAMGNSDNLVGAMVSSAKATAALELTVEISSRAMAAYKEIMSMQV